MKKSFWIHNNWLLWVFLCVLGLIGPIHAGFYKVVCLLIVPAFMMLYKQELKAWYREHPAERHYFYGILIFCVYVFVQVAVWTFLPNPYDYKPKYGAIEEFLFSYLILALLAWVMGVGLSQTMFERIMIAFGICTALGGCFLLWAFFDLSLLWESPKTFLSEVLNRRFTGGLSAKFPTLKIFLKDYSFYPMLGALLLIPIAIKRNGVKRWLLVLVSSINACWLMFTINKGTIIGFGLALIVMAIYFIYKMTWHKKIITLLCLVVVAIGIVKFTPPEVEARFVEMINDGNAFFEEGYESGSTSTRLAIWETLLSHADEFWIFGEGPLYGSNRLRGYFVEEGHQDWIDYGFTYHSQYLTYFHHYGILGLLFLPFLLFYPLYVMIRYRRFSITLTALIIVFAFACIEDWYFTRTMSAATLFLFFFSYAQVDKWRNVENRANS